MIAKRLRSTTNELIRVALLEHVRKIEAQFREEDALKQATKEEKRREKRSILFNPPPIPLGMKEPEDELAKLYAKHARSIFEVLTEPEPLRQRTQDAILAVKRYSPLTHPDDDAICLRLERVLREVQLEDIRRATQAAEVAAPAKPTLTTVTPTEKVGSILDSLLTRITTVPQPTPKPEGESE